VPFSNGHRMVRALVQNAMQSSLRDAGLPWKMYELNHAVLVALETPEAEAQWLAGSDEALRVAVLNDVPEAELKLVYDSLRPAAAE
jgi:hypothetical protein